MSRKANLWAIEQRGLKPTTKIVLWHLCDRFNPTMAASLRKPGWLMTARSADPTLNDHLDRLEAARLLRRVPRIGPVTKRQVPTRYFWVRGCPRTT